ncbi:hypothetical protein CLV56_1717 [Mumia flava]|uniref:Peptidase S55 domain-containing protein n=1 Tax=Mumia flava TaxID=1348852 RepID=A0A0B2BRG2_9ACTN|nr:hypothetical protein [Mumia flava]PJJ57484.1 hypothetical protein CLV56_1717 [Mumia flava]
MSNRPRASVRALRRPLPAVAVASAALLTTGLLGLPPASADDPAAAAAAVGSPCPAAFDPADLVRATATTPGTIVTGLTVSSGTEADAVTGEYVGVLEDGIAPGVDMLIFKMSGSKITKADGSVDRGIWAGMSGSPLYAPDGSLVGAVSYGLAWSPSEYAGVTPAADLYRVGTYAAARSSELSSRVVSTMRTTGANRAEIGSGMRRLPMPISVPSARPGKTASIAKKAGHDRAAFRAGSASSRTGSQPIPISAGSNVAASISYGALSLAGVGTTTAVCGDRVYAFGHPMEWRGPAKFGLHGADAVYIEKDNFDGSFKLANVGAPMGTIDQDRLAAISGKLGRLPKTTPLTTTTRMEGRSRTARTQVVTDDYLSFVAAEQAMLDGWTVADSTVGGTATISRTIVLQRANGQKLTYRRSDMYADPWDVSFTPADPLAGDIDSLVYSSGEKVKVVSASQTATMKAGYRAYRVGKVEARQFGGWEKLTGNSVVAARRGGYLRLRITLKKEQDAIGPATKQVSVKVAVPNKKLRRANGTLSIYGGESGPYGEDEWGYYEDYEDFAAATYVTVGKNRPRSAASLIKEMTRAEHGNDLVVELEMGRRKGKVTKRTVRATSTVVSGAKSFIAVRYGKRR